MGRYPPNRPPRPTAIRNPLDVMCEEVSKYTIFEVIDEACRQAEFGWSPPLPRPPRSSGMGRITGAQAEQMGPMQLYNCGYTIGKIAELCGLSMEQVKDSLYRKSPPPIPPDGWE